MYEIGRELMEYTRVDLYSSSCMSEFHLNKARRSIYRKCISDGFHIYTVVQTILIKPYQVTKLFEHACSFINCYEYCYHMIFPLLTFATLPLII